MAENERKKRILIVEDEKRISQLLEVNLMMAGYECETASDGELGLRRALEGDFDLILLDLMLPKRDGFSVCREVRKTLATPIIMVTAKGEVFDKVLGLELGADDFMVKPIDMKELSVRIKAVLRRCQSTADKDDDECVKYENLEVSRQKYELKINGKPVDTPPKELELLYFLASHPNHVFTRNQLLDKVWDFDYLGDSRTVDVHIKRLREKLDGVSDKWTIRTVHGIGYKFEVL